MEAVPGITPDPANAALVLRCPPGRTSTPLDADCWWRNLSVPLFDGGT